MTCLERLCNDVFVTVCVMCDDVHVCDNVCVSLCDDAFVNATAMLFLT